MFVMQVKWLRIWTLTLNLVWCELSLPQENAQKSARVRSEIHKQKKRRQILAKTKHFLLTYHFINGFITEMWTFSRPKSLKFDSFRKITNKKKKNCNSIFLPEHDFIVNAYAIILG